MDGARPQRVIGLFAAGLDGVRDDAELAEQLAQMLLHANVGNVQVLDRRAGVPLPPAPVMDGARPDGAIGLFEAGPDGVRDDAELAARLAQMHPYANVGNVLLLDRRAKAEARHVSRMQKARDGAAPKPAAPAQPARWAASLRTAAARLPRRSAGVPRAVRLGGRSLVSVQAGAALCDQAFGRAGSPSDRRGTGAEGIGRCPARVGCRGM